MNKESIVEIFRGSDIEANYAAAIIKENGIRCIVRNAFSESIAAGWADGYPASSTALFVDEDDGEKAKALIKEAFNANQQSV